MLATSTYYIINNIIYLVSYCGVSGIRYISYVYIIRTCTAVRSTAAPVLLRAVLPFSCSVPKHKNRFDWVLLLYKRDRVRRACYYTFSYSRIVVPFWHFWTLLSTAVGASQLTWLERALQERGKVLTLSERARPRLSLLPSSLLVWFLSYMTCLVWTRLPVPLAAWKP